MFIKLDGDDDPEEEVEENLLEAIELLNVEALLI